MRLNCEMKRFFLTLTVLLSSIGLLLAVPHAYERTRPTNTSAASFLNQLPRTEIGPTLVECINEINGNRPSKYGYNSLEAHYDFGGDWSNDYYAISGRLGWHATWQALIPLGSAPVTAYDTFEAEQMKAMFRRQIPWKIVGALKRCGAAYDGAWPAELLDKLSPFSSISPPDE